jgi:cell division protein FtsW
MKPHQPDYLFLVLVLIIVIFGLIILSSAGTVVSFQKFQDSFYYFKHQLLYGLIPGIILFFLCFHLNYQIWRRLALGLFILSLIFLVLVFVPGLELAGSRAKSWIDLGLFSFQPSEIVKLTYILYLVFWLEKQGEERLKDFQLGFLPFLAVLGVIMFLIVLETDLGTMSVIVLTALVIYFIAGARLSHLLSFVLLMSGVFFFLVKLAPYRLERFITFLRPGLDPQGIGYHINQAFLAIGSGGWFGKGFGLSRQKFQFLPESMGDSIFAIMAEELGFVICVIFLLLLLALFLRGYKIARNSPDKFSQLIVVGVISWWMIQTFVNIGAIVGLLPLTGVPLIFISYGGTSLAVALAAVGIVANISRWTVR